MYCLEPSQTNFAQLVLTRDAFFKDNEPSLQWWAPGLQGGALGLPQLPAQKIGRGDGSTVLLPHEPADAAPVPSLPPVPAGSP